MKIIKQTPEQLCLCQDNFSGFFTKTIYSLFLTIMGFIVVNPVIVLLGLIFLMFGLAQPFNVKCDFDKTKNQVKITWYYILFPYWRTFKLDQIQDCYFRKSKPYRLINYKVELSIRSSKSITIACDNTFARQQKKEMVAVINEFLYNSQKK